MSIVIVSSLTVVIIHENTLFRILTDTVFKNLTGIRLRRGKTKPVTASVSHMPTNGRVKGKVIAETSRSISGNQRNRPFRECTRPAFMKLRSGTPDKKKYRHVYS